MVRLKSLTVALLVVLLALELLACPVFPLSLNKDNGVVEIGFPEAEVTEVAPVFQKGLSYSAWSREAFGTSESDESLMLLTETNTEWIVICFSWYQSSTTSYDIQIDPNGSPSTESIKHAITVAHSLGLKVMLKPMVEALEREKILSYPVWRGEIEPSEEWFESYSSFINYFAEFAEQNGVEMFCVGCEYKATSGETEQWENVIQGVREHFSGPLTYAADWTNYQNIEWWSSVDYVGIDAYFPLTLLKSDPTLEELKTVWNNHADDIEEWLSTINIPVILTEIGYRSGDGTSMAPSNYWTDMPVDLQEQSDCYEAAFNALWNRSWFYGFYWWTWVFNPAEGGPNDSGHSPQNKPAQDVITRWYSLDRKIAVIDQAVVSAERCDVNEAQTVSFHASWDSDGADVVGASVYVNGTAYVTNGTGWISFSKVYETAGERSWLVTDVQHPEANSYRVSVESPSIVWDKVVVNVEVDSTGFGVTKVKVTLIHAIDGASVTGATLFVNGELCEETEPGVYETELASLSPYQQVTVQTDTAGLADETWSTTVIHLMNIIVYVALSVAVIVIISVLFFKLRRKSAPSA